MAVFNQSLLRVQVLSDPKQVSKLQKKALQNLSRAIDESSDRLFFVRYKEQDSTTETYRLVQAEPTRSYGVAMRDYGVYRCKSWDKHLHDAEKLAARDCRYWPDVRHVTPSGALDKRQPVSPETVKRFLQQNQGLFVWREEDINIADDRLVGPFNFNIQRVPSSNTTSTTRTRASSRKYLIDYDVWKQLEIILDEQGIDRTTINKVIPCNYCRILPNTSHYF